MNIAILWQVLDDYDSLLYFPSARRIQWSGCNGVLCPDGRETLHKKSACKIIECAPMAAKRGACKVLETRGSVLASTFRPLDLLSNKLSQLPSWKTVCYKCLKSTVIRSHLCIKNHFRHACQEIYFSIMKQVQTRRRYLRSEGQMHSLGRWY